MGSIGLSSSPKLPGVNSDTGKISVKNSRNLLIVFVLAGIVFFGSFGCFQDYDYDLQNLPIGQPYSSTKFEFRYGHAWRKIDDPNSHLRFVYGKMPDEITVTLGKRLIVYKSPKAVIKSKSDSIDVRAAEVKYAGYMGITSTETHFTVNHEGEIYGINTK